MYASYGARWRARGDHSPRATPRQLLRSFYIAERAARPRAFGCHCSCFSLSLCVSVSRRFSLFRRSAFVSADTHVSSLPALCSLCSRLCWLSNSSLPLFCSCLCCRLCSRLCSASVSSRLGYALARRVAFYRINNTSAQNTGPTGI